MSDPRETSVSEDPRFPLGRVVATVGALAVLFDAGQAPREFIERHVSGDWGELDSEDSASNEEALKWGLRIFSAYRTSDGEKVWVITEADRSSTTLLLPSEY